jgi:hypothetical protein
VSFLGCVLFHQVVADLRPVGLPRLRHRNRWDHTRRCRVLPPAVAALSSSQIRAVKGKDKVLELVTVSAGMSRKS